MDLYWLIGIGTSVLAAATVGLTGVVVWSLKKSRVTTEELRTEIEKLRDKEEFSERELILLETIQRWVGRVSESIDRYFPEDFTEASHLSAFIHVSHELWNETNVISGAATIFPRDLTDVIKGCTSAYLDLILNILLIEKDVITRGSFTKAQQKLLKEKRHSTSISINFLDINLKGYKYLRPKEYV